MPQKVRTQAHTTAHGHPRPSIPVHDKPVHAPTHPGARRDVLPADDGTNSRRPDPRSLRSCRTGPVRGQTDRSALQPHTMHAPHRPPGPRAPTRRSCRPAPARRLPSAHPALRTHRPHTRGDGDPPHTDPRPEAHPLPRNPHTTPIINIMSSKAGQGAHTSQHTGNPAPTPAPAPTPGQDLTHPSQPRPKHPHTPAPPTYAAPYAHPPHVPRLPGQRNTRGRPRPPGRPGPVPTPLPRLPRQRPPHPTRHPTMRPALTPHPPATTPPG